MKTSIQVQNAYILSNHTIFRQSTNNAPYRLILDSNDPDAHGKVKVLPGGLKFYKRQDYHPPSYLKERAPKTAIEGFSKSSQRNFRDTLMRLDLKPFFCDSKCAAENNGFFISLNWPRENSLNKFSITRDLEKLSKKLRTDFSDSFLGAVWKKELQRQGTPHIHIVTLFDKAMVSQELREWFEDTWATIVGGWLPFAADTRPLYGVPEQLINYLLKDGYENAGALLIGRVWGKWNGKGLPFVVPDEHGLSKEDYIELLERFKSTPQGAHSKIIQKFNENWKGGRVIGDGDILSKLLEALPSGDDDMFF